MAKQFSEWLDEFIDHGFNPENITHWPEEGSEPEVVEELPEDPEFGKVYAISSASDYTYYTIDTNGNWINLSEPGQGGGIIDVDYLPEEAEQYNTYRVTIGTDGTPSGMYYCIRSSSASSGDIIEPYFIRLDGMGAVIDDEDMNVGVVLTTSGSFYSTDNYAPWENCYININPGDHSQGNKFYNYDYTTSSGTNFILDAIYQYVDSGDQMGAFFLGEFGAWETPEEGDVLIPQFSSNEIYYTPISFSGDPLLIYDDGTGNIDYLSSGDPNLIYKHYQDDRYYFDGIDNQAYMSDVLTGLFSGGGFSSGCVYYPSSMDVNTYQEYSDYSGPFIALISPTATEDSPGFWSVGEYNAYDMELGKSYTVVQSSGGSYELEETSTPSYFNTISDAVDALTSSVAHEVSSGDVFDNIFYPSISSGRYYNQTSSRATGYWFRVLSTGSSIDGDTTYGYDPIPLWNEYNSSQFLQEGEICTLLNLVKSGTENPQSEGFSNIIYYPCRTSYGIGYGFTELPTTSTPIGFTINGETYTITKTS